MIKIMAFIAGWKETPTINTFLQCLNTSDIFSPIAQIEFYSQSHVKHSFQLHSPSFSTVDFSFLSRTELVQFGIIAFLRFNGIHHVWLLLFILLSNHSVLILQTYKTHLPLRILKKKQQHIFRFAVEINEIAFSHTFR